MRLTCFSLTLLKVTARYWIPGLWSDKWWYCATRSHKVEAWKNSFCPKREEAKVFLQISILCCFPYFVSVCVALKLFVHRGECQTPSEGTCISLAHGPLGSCKVKVAIPSEREECFLLTGRALSKPGRIISPESIFSFLWLSKWGWWQGNLVSCEGTRCTMQRQLWRWQVEKRTLDLVICF